MTREVTLFTFPSTYYALLAEKLVQESGLGGRLIPVPRALSSSCGLALELVAADEGSALAIFDNAVKLEKKAHAVEERGVIKRIIAVVEYI